MTVAEWSTIASLATALGTLILAVATFSPGRSLNLIARVAHLRLLMRSRTAGAGPLPAGGSGPQGQLRRNEVGAYPRRRRGRRGRRGRRHDGLEYLARL